MDAKGDLRIIKYGRLGLEDVCLGPFFHVLNVRFHIVHVFSNFQVLFRIFVRLSLRGATAASYSYPAIEEFRTTKRLETHVLSRPKCIYPPGVRLESFFR
jgi:hypothetical protein